MQDWTVEGRGVEEVAVLLFPRFSNLCLANAVEPMRAANELLGRTAYRWRFATTDGAGVESSSGLPVLPHGRLRDHPGGDALFVVSSYDARALAGAETARALAAAAGRFRTVAGLDTGAWLMARAGLLEGRRATIHWDELDAFAEAFPGVEAVRARTVQDGDRITCGGAMTAFDLVLERIRRRHGAALALELAAFFLHRASDAPAAGPRASAPVERALTTMRAEIEAPLSIAAVARAAGVSQKALGRAFRAELGAAPATVYRHLRLAAARRYVLGTRHSVAEIALRCGYADAAAMTRAFVAVHGKPPRQMRREAAEGPPERERPPRGGPSWRG